MNEKQNINKPVSPKKVLEKIAEAIPKDCKKHIIVIGSLAVGYHYFGDNHNMSVRTKDADCLLSPKINAIPAGIAITEKLINLGWKFSDSGEWKKPGDQNTPLDELPAVRLYPPQEKNWFIELLTIPDNDDKREKKWERLNTCFGDFGLPSFGYLGLTNYKPILTDLGIYIARSEMMALANMLEHAKIKSDTMSSLIQGRIIKRSNKNLGRVLAIAYLSTAQDVDSLGKWKKPWENAIKKRFPKNWQELSQKAGLGIRELLNSDLDFEEAYHTCIYGLLASNPPNRKQLKIVGERLLQDVIEPFEII